MVHRFLTIIGGIVIGLSIGYSIVFYFPYFLPYYKNTVFPRASNVVNAKQVIGFLPYWLVGKKDTDYSKYITTLTYFGLTVDTDGTILKMTDPQSSEPGWYALQSGKLETVFSNLQAKGVSLSLLIFAGDEKTIDAVLSDPIHHARNLTTEVIPLMHTYGFTDLNLDIESIKTATPGAQVAFTQFATEVKKQLDVQHAGTLTIEVSPSDFIKDDLIKVSAIGPITDHLVIMAYDYHYTGSYVSGPVAPLFGAGTTLEFDTQTAVEKAEYILPKEKIILGIPLYGYEWETLSAIPRAAVIPETGVIASNERVENFLQACATCSAILDPVTKEPYIIYADQDTGTYHQIFYPDKNATQAKVDFANTDQLGGVAVWALGYEGATILDPLAVYKK